MPVAAVQFIALLCVALSSGCFRQNLKKDGGSIFPNDPPVGKAAARGPDVTQVTPPAPPGGAIQPPRSDLMSGSIPPMPGMPGTASRPQTDFDSSDFLLTSAAADADDRKGPLRRWLEDRREKKNQPIPLPPALETPKKDPMKPMTMPTPAPVVPDQPPAAPTPVEKPANSLDAARKVVELAAKVYGPVPDYQVRVTKREVVAGKQQPVDEAELSFRKEPYSVHLKVVGENGTGREVLYVKGQNGGKMVILTGKGDIISGLKKEIDPDSPLVSGRSRGKIYDSGVGRPIAALTKLLDQADAGKRPADTIKFLGPVDRKETKTSVVGIEVKLLPGDDPLLPKGGVRSYYFDADPKSAGYGLPALITTTEGGKEVEYYCFNDYRVPARLTDADFSPDRIGKKR